MGIISGLFSIGTSIAANRRMKKIARQNQAILDKQARDNEAWYNRRYNEDALAQADAQRALTKVGNAVRQRNQQAAGNSAVMGGTGAQEAAARAQNNEAYSDTASNIAANAAAKKDAIEQQYMANKQNLANQQMAVNSGKIGQVANAATQIGAAAGSMFGSLDNGVTDFVGDKISGLFKKK